MIKGKYLIVKNYITACDYKYVLKKLEKSISLNNFLLVSPIASQTLALAFYNRNFKGILDKYNLLLPDSQWIKRSIFLLYGIRLKERVYGSDLMLNICKFSEEKKYKIFLYGTDKPTLNKLSKRLKVLFPALIISGTEPSKFSNLSLIEKKQLIKRIESSNPDIMFVGLGSPLQEIFSHNLVYKNPHINRPLSIITVGAAFDFIAKTKKQAPKSLQNAGLEWLFRLFQEPNRLWKRYILYGTLFIFLILRQKIFILFYSQYNYQKQTQV